MLLAEFLHDWLGQAYEAAVRSRMMAFVHRAGSLLPSSRKVDAVFLPTLQGGGRYQIVSHYGGGH